MCAGANCDNFGTPKKDNLDRIAALDDCAQGVFLALNYFGSRQKWNLAFQLRQVKRAPDSSCHKRICAVGRISR